MKTNGLQSYLLFAILGGFVAWMVWGQEPIEVDVKGYETKILNLEKLVDSTYNLNSDLTSKIESMNINLQESDAKIKQLNGRIWTIKKETDEKLNAINDYSNDELYLFFTERYGQYNDSIKETDSKVSN